MTKILDRLEAPDEFLKHIDQYIRYDPDIGFLFWKSPMRNHKVGDKASVLKKDGRHYLYFKGKSYMAYRIAWLIYYRKWPDNYIDHIDGDSSNDRIVNLRDVPAVVNSQNFRKAMSNNATGLLGVSWKKSRSCYRSQIRINNKKVHLGYFDTAEEAHVAYLAAKRKFHEGCTI